MKNIPEELIPVIDYWEQHGKATVAVALVALVAGVGYWAWDRAQAQTRQEVADALVENYIGMLPGMTVRQAASSAVDELQSAIEKAKDPSVVPLLKLRLAKMQYDAGDYAAAEALYTELKASAPAGYEDVPAAGLAATLEAAGKYAEAQAAYDAILAAKTPSALALEVNLGSARCLAAAGKKEAAVTALEALLKAEDGLAAAKAAKEEALAAAQKALEPLTKRGLTRKDEEFAAATAKIADLSKELAALDGALKDKNAATARIKATLELVKRWEKREAVTLANAAAAQVAEAARALETKAAEAPKAEVPAPAAGAEKKTE